MGRPGCYNPPIMPTDAITADTPVPFQPETRSTFNHGRLRYTRRDREASGCGTCRRVGLLLLMMTLAFGAVGCDTGSFVPQGWIQHDLDPNQSVRHGSAHLPRSAASAQSHAAAVTDSDATAAPTPDGALPRDATQTPPRGKLQIIIAYGDIFSKHSALRIDCPGRNPLFWDPGGSYRDLENDPPTNRRREDIVEPAPAWQLYSTYRYDRARERRQLVFIWHIPVAQAQRIHDELARRGRAFPDRDAFPTDITPGFCTLALTDFLTHYAAEQTGLDGMFLIPGSLGRYLWDRLPDRVEVYEMGKFVRYFMPEKRFAQGSAQPMDPRPAAGPSSGKVNAGP